MRRAAEPPGEGDAAGFVAGNVYDKYGTTNPLYRRLMEGFLARCGELLERAAPRRVLEVGCGTGELARRLFPSSGVCYVGSDLSVREVAAARRESPGRRFVAASADRLPFRDGAFDCVVACEVFEHLEAPRRALAEVERVTAAHLLVSVPWEPVWRVLNILRGAYLARLGDTPGHLQHFSRRAIRQLVGRRFAVVAERRPFPWTVLLAVRRGSSGG